MLCSPSAAQGWSCYRREKYHTGFPISDLVNAKFTLKDNILLAHQWLKAIWLSLGAFFTKNRVMFKEGAGSGLAAAAFLGHPGGLCSGLQSVWGEKPEVRGCVGSQGWEKLWTSPTVPQGWSGAQKKENWL